MLLPLLQNNLLDTDTPFAVVSGGTSLTEAQIVSGGQQIVITLSNDTWVAAGATFNAQRQGIIDGITSAQSEATGWNAVVRDAEVVTAVVRTSDTVLTITLTAAPTYNVTANETITVTIPASALVTSASPLVAGQSIAVTADAPPSSSGGGGHFVPRFAGIRSGRKVRKDKKPAEAALEAAEAIVDSTISKTIEAENRPVKRVSRRLKTKIIEESAEQVREQEVFIGELAALERAVDLIAKDRLKARRNRTSPNKAIEPVIQDDEEAITLIYLIAKLLL